MFGITTLGWIHTLASLPAIPTAVYMFARYGRIVPRSTSGVVYFISMLIGAITVFPIAHQPISDVIAVVTLILLLVGYGVELTRKLGRATQYIETICLGLTTFLLMVPSVSETLRRVPDGHPIVTDLKSPILIGAQGALLALLIVGVTAQIVYMRKRGRR